MPPLILASASPRRRQLLALAGWPFSVATADVDETPLPGEAPVDFVSRLSQAKARAVAARLPQPQADPPLVIACDTTVVLDDRLLNKPADAAEARAMLTEQLQNGERALGSWSQGVVRGSDEGFFEHSKFRNVSGFGILACVSDTA